MEEQPVQRDLRRFFLNKDFISHPIPETGVAF